MATRRPRARAPACVPACLRLRYTYTHWRHCWWPPRSISWLLPSRKRMEYRLFGKSGLAVSCIGYGCMTFGDPAIGNMSQAETEAMVRNMLSTCRRTAFLPAECRWWPALCRWRRWSGRG